MDWREWLRLLLVTPLLLWVGYGLGYMRGSASGVEALRRAIQEDTTSSPYNGPCRQCYYESATLCATLAAAPPEAKRRAYARGGYPICDGARVVIEED